MEIVQQIENVSKDGRDRPIKDVIIAKSGELEMPKDEEGKQEDDHVLGTAPPPVKDTPTPPAENPEVEAALDGVVEVTYGFSFGALLFGFVFVAGCAALFVRFNGMQRISKVFGFGKYRYRRMGDADLEQ